MDPYTKWEKRNAPIRAPRWPASECVRCPYCTAIYGPEEVAPVVPGSDLLLCFECIRVFGAPLDDDDMKGAA